MIPGKKKTPEEIAALREGLGIPPVPPVTAAPSVPVPPMPEVVAKNKDSEPESTAAQPDADAEPVVHLDLAPTPVRPEKAESRPTHTLRKHELPLAPAPSATRHTELPTRRHDARDVAQIRKREALAQLQLQQGADPAAHLRRQTASPFLYGPGYFFAFAAALTAYQGAHYATPAGLTGVAIVVMLFIAWRKPRSRHHAALLFIVVFLTLVFGALHYAPLFQNVP